MAPDEGGGDSAGAPSGPGMAHCSPSHGAADAIEAASSALLRTQPSTEKQGAWEPCSGLDRSWASSCGPRGNWGQAARPGMRRLSPGRAGDGLRSCEQPQAELPWTRPHQPLVSPLGALRGLGSHIPGPSGPCLSSTESGSLRSRADASECTLPGAVFFSMGSLWSLRLPQPQGHFLGGLTSLAPLGGRRHPLSTSLLSPLPILRALTWAVILDLCPHLSSCYPRY